MLATAAHTPQRLALRLHCTGTVYGISGNGGSGSLLCSGPFPYIPFPSARAKMRLCIPCCLLWHTLQRKLPGLDSGVAACNRIPAKKHIACAFLFFGTRVGGLCEQWYWCSLAQGLLFTFAVPMACTYVRPPWHKIGLYPLSLGNSLASTAPQCCACCDCCA